MTLLALALAVSASPDLGLMERDALANADEANRAFVASHRYLEGWLALQDPETKLIPQRVDDPTWTTENSAADHYAFMVLTCYFTDPERLATTMREILDSEMRISTRVRSLPEGISLRTDSFVRPEPDHGSLIFGAAEYCKDGLLPIAEAMGPSPWFDRLVTMSRDIILENNVETAYGKIPSPTAEVNGNMLQVCSRLYGATGDPFFLDAALTIADAYFFEVLPGNGGIPCHIWDFAAHRPTNATLNLYDHGSEIVGGLSEAFVAASVHRPEKAAQYREPLRRMLDTILRRFTNPDGIFSTAPEKSGGVPDTWGYLYNAYITASVGLGEERYRDAAARALQAVCGYLDWGGADAYADCEESAIILLNRIPCEPTLEWLKKMLERHYAYQQANGIIEGWYGDGNSARTWQLYAMMKTGGTRITPWRQDVRYGAAYDADTLVLAARADSDWSGTLYFDHPRHADHCGLTLNYPRLNEWPEWWPVDSGAVYEVQSAGHTERLTGYHLIEGIPLRVRSGQVMSITVRRVSEYPHAQASLSLDAPRVVSSAVRAEAVIRVTNTSDRAVSVDLSASQGRLLLNRTRLGPGEAQSVPWSAAGMKEGMVLISARCDDEGNSTSAQLRVLDQPGLLDTIPCTGGGTHAGEVYRWLGNGDIQAAVRTAGATNLLLSFRWGSKSDTRHALLKVGDTEREFVAGGYNGFEWMDVRVKLPQPQDTTPIEVRATGSGPQGFFSEILVIDANVADRAREAERLRSQAPWAAQPRVLIITHDPIIRSAGGKRLHEVMGWNDPARLAEEYIADVARVSGGMVRYRIVDHITVDGFPVKTDGFAYTEETFLADWRTREFHQPDGVDYAALIREFDLAGRASRGEIDEVWFFGAPYFGYYESIMVGPHSWWCNAPPLTDIRTKRRFVIMGFSYERGVGEMLEDLGHRAESMVWHAFGSWDPAPTHAWNRFTLHEKALPGQAGCGNVHFAPNSESDYDWGNARFVLSAADDWPAFPRLTGRRRLLSCDSWGSGDIRAHHTWWLAHLPRTEGSTDGVDNNWWRTVVDINR